MKICKVALIGINGFGRMHLEKMLELQERGNLELLAVSEIRFSSEDRQLLQNKGIHCYTDYKEMLLCETSMELVVLSTPIHLHTVMGIDIMEAGYHAFLEKPPASVIQDVDRLIEVSRKTGKLCAVNFLLTSGKAFLELKKTIENGVLGDEIRTITGIGLWQRSDEYYNRTYWAGKLKAGEEYILDGTINNPLSHLLNNMLVLSNTSIGKKRQAVIPIEVTGELYHANEIEGEDTTCLRVKMSNAVEMYYYATLCSGNERVPSIRVEGTKGIATWRYDNTWTLDKSGMSTTIECGEENFLEVMYLNLLSVINGEESTLICPIEATRNFTLVANGAFESSGQIHDIPLNHIQKITQGSSTINTISDIAELVTTAAKNNQLFSEAGIPWAKHSKPFELKNYNQFPVFFRV